MKHYFTPGEAGAYHALVIAIRALVASHPQPDLLLAAFEEEHDRAMAGMLARPYPEEILDAYRECLRRFAPDGDGRLEA
jgi:hypothetical protein